MMQHRKLEIHKIERVEMRLIYRGEIVEVKGKSIDDSLSTLVSQARGEV